MNCEDVVSVSPPIAKLNEDVFFEILDNLSLQDVLSYREANIWFEDIGGKYFNVNYGAAEVTIDGNSFKMFGTCVNEWSDYIQRLKISGRYMAAYDSVQERLRDKSVTDLKICNTLLSSTKIKRLINILPNTESLMLQNCTLKNELFDKVLTLCPKLKHLSVVTDLNPIMGINNN